jgi:multidrug efflux pump subunit AcrA (membrane-fusion protein)
MLRTGTARPRQWHQCRWCGRQTQTLVECPACRRGSAQLERSLWDPEAVQELQWDAGLAWSPLWTLVPDVEPPHADVDAGTRQRELHELDGKLEAERKAAAERQRVQDERERRRIERERATRARVAAEQRARAARARAESAAKSERMRAQRGSMDFSRYGGQFGPTAAEIADAEARVGSATTEADVRAARAAGPVMMEPPPGSRDFKHAMPITGVPCVSAWGAPQCPCGFYRLTWTVEADLA